MKQHKVTIKIILILSIIVPYVLTIRISVIKREYKYPLQISVLQKKLFNIFQFKKIEVYKNPFSTLSKNEKWYPLLYSSLLLKFKCTLFV